MGQFIAVCNSECDRVDDRFKFDQSTYLQILPAADDVLQVGDGGVSDQLFNVCLRFRNVPVDSDATLDNVLLRLQSVRILDSHATLPSSESACPIRIYGHKIVDAASSYFTTTQLQTITKTTSYVDYDYPEVPDDGPELQYDDFDVTTIVAEIIAQDGWESGNSMRFIIEYRGAVEGGRTFSAGSVCAVPTDATAPSLIGTTNDEVSEEDGSSLSTILELEYSSSNDAGMVPGTECRRIAVDQQQGGDNYPFASVTTLAAQVILDFYLAYEDDFDDLVRPFRIDWLHGFGRAPAQLEEGIPLPTHRMDLRVKDANDTTVFDSTTATSFYTQLWGDSKEIVEWRSDTVICRVVRCTTVGHSYEIAPNGEAFCDVCAAGTLPPYLPLCVAYDSTTIYRTECAPYYGGHLLFPYGNADGRCLYAKEVGGGRTILAELYEGDYGYLWIKVIIGHGYYAGLVYAGPIRLTDSSGEPYMKGYATNPDDPYDRYYRLPVPVANCRQPWTEFDPAGTHLGGLFPTTPIYTCNVPPSYPPLIGVTGGNFGEWGDVSTCQFPISLNMGRVPGDGNLCTYDCPSSSEGSSSSGSSSSSSSSWEDEVVFPADDCVMCADGTCVGAWLATIEGLGDGTWDGEYELTYCTSQGGACYYNTFIENACTDPGGGEVLLEMHYVADNGGTLGIYCAVFSGLYGGCTAAAGLFSQYGIEMTGVGAQPLDCAMFDGITYTLPFYAGHDTDCLDAAHDAVVTISKIPSVDC